MLESLRRALAAGLCFVLAFGVACAFSPGLTVMVLLNAGIGFGYGGNILVVEDNYGGGLGSAIADACTAGGDAFTVKQLHVRRIPKSARTTDEAMRMCGLDARSIATAAGSIVGITA